MLDASLSFQSTSSVCNSRHTPMHAFICASKESPAHRSCINLLKVGDRGLTIGNALLSPSSSQEVGRMLVTYYYNYSLPRHMSSTGIHAAILDTKQHADYTLSPVSSPFPFPSPWCGRPRLAPAYGSSAAGRPRQSLPSNLLAALPTFTGRCPRPTFSLKAPP